MQAEVRRSEISLHGTRPCVRRTAFQSLPIALARSAKDGRTEGSAVVQSGVSSGNMLEELQASAAENRQQGAIFCLLSHLCVFNVLAEVDREYPTLAPHVECIQLGRHAFGHGPGLCAVQKLRNDVHRADTIVWKPR